MTTVQVIIRSYLPGTRAGGPVRTTANMIGWLGDDFRFQVLTSDTDLGATTPYHDITYGAWQPVGKGLVRYLSQPERTLWGLAAVLQETDYDVLYLDTPFATLTVWVLSLRRLGHLPDRPAVLHPRGTLARSALAVKPHKKRPFLAAARAGGLFRGVRWHASSPYEAADITREIGPGQHITVQPNLPDPTLKALADQTASPQKSPGALRVVFLSRIHPIKNLGYALDVLAGVTGDITFDIYGPVEDDGYWQACQAKIDALPPNIHATYHGPVAFDAAPATFSGYHVFLFPTQGENFGHVILEALAAGCAVITSDQTPWHALGSVGAGHAPPLANSDGFREALQTYIDMDAPAMQAAAANARRHAQAHLNPGKIMDGMAALFTP